MVYQLERIVRDVRVAMDQNAGDVQLIAGEDEDTLSLDEIIRSKAVEAVRRVESSAPMQYLEEGHQFGDSVSIDADGSGRVLLPDDFMRLVAFRMSDWERTVYGAIAPAHPQYAQQSSRFKGLRGTPQKPVCAIVNRPEGKTLEFYSCDSDEAYVEYATYIPYPAIDDSDGIDISERCYEAVIYTAASLVLTAYGEADKAQLLASLAKSIFE